MALDVLERFGQAVARGVRGRCAHHHLHGRELARDDAAVGEAAVAEAEVDAVGGEIGDPVVEDQFDIDAGMQPVEIGQQRADDPAAEADRRAHAQLPARGPVLQLVHLLHRLHDLLDPGRLSS